MLLQMTLGQAFKDLLVFVAMTIILFVGFVVMGLNIFGMQAPSYNTILNTLGTLFLILLGEFDYAEMNAVSRIWAIIFFIIFVLFMFFVVLNIFLAILNDAYTVVHTQNIWEELEKRKPLSLREKFEVRRAMWRERRNIARINKLKREKVKQEKKRKKELEKHLKNKSLLEKIGTRRPDEGPTPSGADEKQRRGTSRKLKPFG